MRPSCARESAGAAPAAGEVAATIDALLAANLLRGRAASRQARARGKRCTARLPPGSRALAAVGKRHAATPTSRARSPSTHLPRGRLLDIGCGLGQIARHAAALGYRVVATDISEAALALARDAATPSDIVWLRDDICATALVGPFDVIVDRASFTRCRPRARLRGPRPVQRITASGASRSSRRIATACPARRTATAPRARCAAPRLRARHRASRGAAGPRRRKPIASVLVVLADSDMPAAISADGRTMRLTRCGRRARRLARPTTDRELRPDRRDRGDATRSVAGRAVNTTYHAESCRAA